MLLYKLSILYPYIHLIFIYNMNDVTVYKAHILYISCTKRFRIRERAYGCHREGSWDRMVREFGMDKYRLLYLKWMTNKGLLYSTWNSAQCYVAARMRGEFGGEWLHGYIWLSPFASHLSLHF